MRHQEFLGLGGRVYGLSADPHRQNAAVAEKLALPFQILSDPNRDRAIAPLGFADEKDPRLISRPGVVILDRDGEEVWRHRGRDYADRPHEDLLLGELAKLSLNPTTQDPPRIDEAEAGPNAVPLAGLSFYMRGAKFAALALRSRHRSISEEFKDDAKEYVARADRYLEALAAVEERRA